MHRGVKLIFSISLVVVLVALSFGDGNAAPAATKKVELKLWGGPIGSSGYILSFGLAEIVNKYSDRIHIGAMETKGWSADIMGWQLLPKEEAKYLIQGGSSPIHIQQGREGKKPLKGPFMAPRCLAMMCHMPSPWITINPKLKTASDLKGKKIIFGGARSAFAYSMVAILEAWGLPEKEYRRVPGGFTQGVDGLIDGTIDVAYMGSSAWGTEKYLDWTPNPGAERLYSSKVCYVIDPPLWAYKKAREKTGYPIYALGCKAKKVGKTSLPNFHSMPNDTSWWVHKDLPGDVVKELCTIIYDHIGEFGKYHATGKVMRHEALTDATCPKDWYHPTAIKLYEGKGLKFRAEKD